MFKIYFDGNRVNDPINWMDFTETIERAPEIKGILPKYDVELEFTGDAFKYLYDLKKSQGYCTIVEFRAEQICSDPNVVDVLLNGYIFLADCKFNPYRTTVKCPIQDNNYSSRIHNNKGIKIYLDSSLSKNLTSIFPCVIKNITFFKPSDGLDVVGLRKCYPVWNAFKYLIDFMSDGLIDFESDYLDPTLTPTDNPQRRLTITSGGIIRGTDTISPQISFEGLFQNINKKYPISFTIRYQSNGRPLIKIENDAYFYGSSSGVKIENVVDMIRSIDEEILYSQINIGGTTVDYNPSIHSVPDTIRMLFEKESYYFQTTCNIDKTLDLVTEYICDSNIIEELVDTNTGETSYDKDVFFIEVNYSAGVAGNTAIQTHLYDTTSLPVYYNGNLTNVQTSTRLDIYADLIQYIDSNDIGFQASRTVQYTFPYHATPDYSTGIGGLLIPLFSPVILLEYQDDTTFPNHDAGGNFTADSRYTAPGNGHYYFRCHLRLALQGQPPVLVNIMIRCYLTMRKYDAGGTLIESYQVVLGPAEFYTYKVFTAPGTFDMNADKMFFLETGQYVETYFQWSSLPYQQYASDGHFLGNPSNGRVAILASNETYFKTLTTESNGVLVAGNSNTYICEKLEFEAPLSNQQYKQLKQDLGKSLIVNEGLINNEPVQDKEAWIRKMTRNMATGKVQVELVSNFDKIR